MNTIETLKAVKALIEDPAHWTQGTYARNAKGRVVSANGQKATCFCVAGALRHVAPVAFEQSASQWILIWRAAERLFLKDPYRVNDDEGHAAVMKVLDAAIADAEKLAEAEKAG